VTRTRKSISDSRRDREQVASAFDEVTQ